MGYNDSYFHLKALKSFQAELIWKYFLDKNLNFFFAK